MKPHSDAKLWRNLFRNQAKEPTIEESLGTIPIFLALAPREVRIIAELIHNRQFQAGETIFQEGDPGTGLYVIRKGSVAITVTDKDQSEVELAQLVAGDFFGETTMVDGGPRTATARALEPTELLGFFRPDLLEIIERYPRIGAKILLEVAQVLSGRLRQTNSDIKRLAGDIRIEKKRDEA